MTILSAQTIRRLCSTPHTYASRALVRPFYERTVVHGKTFGLSAAGYDVRVDLGDKFSEGWMFIRPGGFELVATEEQFAMPKNVMGIVHDKSSWARKGITVQNTVIEPGWRGYLTLELANHGRKDLCIKQNDPIAQIVFHFLDEPTDQPYVGKYQNQGRGPREAIEETA